MTKKMKERIDAILLSLIDTMKQHGTSWTKCWKGGIRPVNLVTKSCYRGINVLLLMYASLKRGFTSQHWASMKQWNEKGYMVTGKSESIIFFKQVSKTKTDEVTGEEMQGDVYWVHKYYNVFNGSQAINKSYLSWITNTYRYTDGDTKAKTSKVVDIEAVDKYINNTKADIRHGGDKAFYTPTEDFIGMPNKSSFIDTDDADATGNYYGTKLHELAHWTGHKTRLDRFGKAPASFGDDKYAYEELVAEISSTLLSIELGVDAEPRADHAKYLNGWLKVLENDSKVLISASTKATQVLDYLNELQE